MTGERILINYYGFEEKVTIGDIGNVYVDIIFENGDTKKVLLEDLKRI